MHVMVDDGKRELVAYLLERYAEEEPPDSVKAELARLLSTYGEGRELLRELAQVSMDQARRAFALAESELFYYDAEQIRLEIDLIEDEKEAELLAANSNESALEAHTVFFALLPQESDATERRRRIIAMALSEGYPERAATFLTGYEPRYDRVEFWSHFLRSLFLRLKTIAPLQAILVVQHPIDAHSWLLELLTTPDTDLLLIEAVAKRVLAMERPIELSLPETIGMINALYERDTSGRIELLCLLALSGQRPVGERLAVLKTLLQGGKSLPESERTRLAEVICRDGIGYLRAEDRSTVLQRLTNFTRHYHPEIWHEIRALRAMALLIHLHPCRLAQARKWAHAYDKRFSKRLQAIQQEHALLIERASILIRAIDARKSGMEISVL